MTKASKWLLGCGIGCGALVLVLVGLSVGGGALLLRETMKGFEGAVDARQALDERFGEVGAFVPWADGTVPADRVETFLAVREATGPAREEIAAFFASLPVTEEEARELESKGVLETIRFVFGITKSGIGMGGAIGELFQARNKALLAHDMSMGEYTYVYVLAYYGLLGHAPAEGPEEAIRETAGDRADTSDVNVKTGLDSVTSRLRRDLLSMLRNQLAAVERQPGADAAWKETLAAEVEALEADRRQLPWQDGLPPAIAASLEPYRERFGRSYSAATNPFELARNIKRGRWSYGTE